MNQLPIITGQAELLALRMQGPADQEKIQSIIKAGYELAKLLRQ